MKSAHFRHLTLTLPVFTAAALFNTALAQAQWSADPANNLIIADQYDNQTQAKIVAREDGGYYVTWFDDHEHGFGVHIQRLDAAGNKLWGNNGIQVAERQLDYTYDYGLAIDASGAAYVAYNCCSNGSPEARIVVSKITAQGELAWGANGLAVSAPAATEPVYAAKVTVTSDDHVVVAWTSETGVRVQKLNTEGQAQWPQHGLLLTSGDDMMFLADVQPSTNGDVIVSWSSQNNSERILRAQKLAAGDGATQWGASGVRVFAEGNLQLGYFPPFIADGNGGAVFYTYDEVDNRFHTRVQRLDSHGAPLFPASGVLTSTDTEKNHLDIAASFDPVSGDIYAVWVDEEVQAGAVLQGLYAQRIDSSGQRQWGDSGKELVPMTDATDSTHVITDLTALIVENDLLASWTTGAIPAANQPIKATRIRANGEHAWAAQNVSLKTLRQSGWVGAAINSQGQAVYVWSDGDADSSTIRAQNLLPDGRLGTPDNEQIFADGFES